MLTKFRFHFINLIKMPIKQPYRHLYLYLFMYHSRKYKKRYDNIALFEHTIAQFYTNLKRQKAPHSVPRKRLIRVCLLKPFKCGFYVCKCHGIPHTSYDET